MHLQKSEPHIYLQAMAKLQSGVADHRKGLHQCTAGHDALIVWAVFVAFTRLGFEHTDMLLCALLIHCKGCYADQSQSANLQGRTCVAFCNLGLDTFSRVLVPRPALIPMFSSTMADATETSAGHLPCRLIICKSERISLQSISLLHLPLLQDCHKSMTLQSGDSVQNTCWASELSLAPAVTWTKMMLDPPECHLSHSRSSA